ncbi:MAG TPA: phosphatase PAP2 family protein [Allosphingosinicella sp.]|jgi:membrane-associated phospholipid phosphatase
MTKKSKKAAKAVKAAARAEKSAVAAMEPLRGSALLDRLADLGDQPQLRTISAAMIAAGLAAGRRSDYGPRLVRAGLRMLVAHEAATFAKNFVKKRIDRRRPRSNGTRADDHLPTPGRSTQKEDTSFPSGHSAGASAAMRALSREFPEHGGKAAAAGAALALVQIPRCAHYPTDVAAGLAIGLAAEAAVAALWPAAPRGATAPQPVREPLPCVTC